MTHWEVLASFTRIRETAEAYMDELDELGHGWVEESVTDVAVHRGYPHVKVIKFNRRQEAVVGGDYLWWWLDSSSSLCFGMLVQAKRLSREGSRWHIDISHNDGQQLRDLLRAAEQLQVPALYGVYTGGRVFRADLPCFHSQEADCLGCRRMAISMITAYQLSGGWSWPSPVDTANLVLDEGLPLEDLVDPERQSGPVRDINLPEIPEGQLRAFLLDDQAGPREVAKRIFRAVSDHRRGAFRAASAAPTGLPGAPLFPEVPEDPGHFPGSYYRHVLQGLRTRPPRYVEVLRRRTDIDDGSMSYVVAVGPPGPRRPLELAGLNIAGVVLVTI
ncbi:hypothetical protein GP2_032_00330 [Gordonia paraffinivorans NBRC 108238]|uniref:Uncharacterized protein n=1 Tax=Gordonia paraffinivorans NBRC 108238 TaxID=1223543 RepID=A0ABQ0IPB6_9ACTN|nr:DUF6615 family protein [Gordonia paraffinivorans]GAC85263.1 hypothetical protein GP2_032_00330 [Gordonia paraffinivorans NBRC 108238]